MHPIAFFAGTRYNDSRKRPGGMTMKQIEHCKLDEERALYALKDAQVRNCEFAGPADGESALKECRNIEVEDCLFRLRYPFWHTEHARIRRIDMNVDCRAAMWYDRDFHVEDSHLGGIKAFRECENASLRNCTAESTEFGWCCRDLKIDSCKLLSEYPFLHCERMEIDHLEMKGKYSFQYCRDVVIRNSVLDTKDAFWHSDHVTVYDSVIKGEYLAWYSSNLRLVRCRIIGTQPLCYCKNLILEDCTMEQCDLSFENSEVHATVCSSIDSVKNPASGSISCERVGELIEDEYQWTPHGCEISETRA